ncbi:MAG: tyrosine-type recombinase/integrase, partial [Eubacterium sp.]
MEKGLLEFIKKIRKHMCKNKITMDDYFDAWLDQREKEGMLKIKTLENYTRQIKRHLAPVFGAVPVKDVTTTMIQQFITTLEVEKGLSVMTIRNILGRLATVMQKAVQEGLITVNPCEGMIFPKGKQRKGQAMTHIEQQRLEKCIDKETCVKDLAIKLALYSGMRVSEITALRWQDIDFVNGFIHVYHSFQRIKIDNKGSSKTMLFFGVPKSEKSIRNIPMNDILLDSLKKYYEQLPAIQKRDEAFVIGKKDGSYYDVRALQRHFKQKIKAAAIPDYHFHDLRHTFATNAKESGVDIQ